MSKIKGIVIAGATSGVGKTTISTAIMYNLIKKGYKVQPFKVGPDYIDPYYHNIVTKRKSKNLDVWLMGRRGVIESFYETSKESDFAVVEGVMGLYDGLSGKNNFASTAHISKILDLPIILIIDSRKAARSLAAITMGFLRFDKSIKIRGIILNNISSERHLRYITEAFESKINVPIIGYIYNNKEIKMQSRHLGLIPTKELDSEILKSIINNSKMISEYIQIEKLINIAKENNNTNNKDKKKSEFISKVKITKNQDRKDKETKVKIVVALDKSFNFYYQDNLEILNKNAVIEFFSPLDDKSLPYDCSGIIIGGGFPEVIAEKLEKNSEMRKIILNKAQDNIPIYAECGGLMYLTKSIKEHPEKKRKYKMVNLFDAETTMTKKLTLGYTKATIDPNDSFFKNIKKIRGHEFHYSNINLNNSDLKMIYTLDRGTGLKDKKDAFYLYNCVASYMHTHFINNAIPTAFLNRCFKYSKK